MAKLTEAGTLYLKDYLVLNAARQEAENYLNSVVDELCNMLTEDIVDLSTDYFSINVWNNKASKGHLEVSFTYLKNSETFKKGKTNFYVSYRDIRNTEDIHPTACKVYSLSPAVTRVNEKITSLISEDVAKKVYRKESIEFDLDNSQYSAEQIRTQILRICEGFLELASEIEEASVR